MLKSSSPRLLYSLLALSLSTGLVACGPAPTSQPGPSTAPSASPSASTQPSPAPQASPTPAMSALLKVHLQADASLAGFATAQAGPFTLCLGQIAKAETKVGSGAPVSRNLNLQALLAGVDFELPGVPTGSLEGRTTFFDAEGHELGFVSWQANIPAEGGSVSVLLKANADTHASEACPRLEATVRGGTILGAGGQVVNPSPLPNPVTTPTPGPTPTPVPSANAPALPSGLAVVEQTTSSLTLQWEFGDGPLSYTLYRDGQKVQGEWVSPNYYRFDGLSASTQYTLGVQAVNTGGTSQIASLSSTTLSSGHSGSGGFSGGGSSRPRSSPSPDLVQPDEFRVNTYTSLDQGTPDIAMDDDGNHVVVWVSGGQDGSAYGIYGQRYDNSGDPQGTEFRVNSFTSGNQAQSRVAMDSAGNFVVVWTSQDADGHLDGIFAQRYDSRGNRAGSEFQVNEYTLSNQDTPDVAMDDAGNFVVVWASQVEDTNFTAGIYGQRYDSSGNRIGSEFQVNSYITDDQTAPAVAMDETGNFVVVWQSDTQDGDRLGVFAQRYNSLGSRAGSEFQVNTYTTELQQDLAVAMDGDGDFIIVWRDESRYDDIQARLYSSSGVASGSEFTVNSYTTNAQYEPAIATDQQGNFIVVWSSDVFTESGNTGEVFCQRLNSSGTLIGSEFQVNTLTTEDQLDASVASDAEGNFTVVWGDYSPGPGDVRAQRYSQP